MRNLLIALFSMAASAAFAQSSLIDAGGRGAVGRDASGRAISAIAARAAIREGRLPAGGISGQAATELVGLPPLNDLTFGAPGGLSQGAGDYTRSQGPGDLTQVAPRVQVSNSAQQIGVSTRPGGANLVPSSSGSSSGSTPSPAGTTGLGAGGLGAAGGSPGDLLRSFGR